MKKHRRDLLRGSRKRISDAGWGWYSICEVFASQWVFANRRGGRAKSWNKSWMQLMRLQTRIDILMNLKQR